MNRHECNNLTIAVLIFAGWLAPGSTEAQQPDLLPEHGVTATFSIVAADPATGECGAAVASKFPAVGVVVPYVRAGVGAFCTQHWHEPSYGEQALEMLEAGLAPEEVLATLLDGDPRREKRQLAIVDMQGRAVNRNPTRADTSGTWWGGMSGRYYACQGNTLAGREVIVAMARAYEETHGTLADRLMAALLAGDLAGGDHRGRLAAGIRVAKTGVDGLWLDLQVDKSDDAVRELVERYVKLEHDAKGEWADGQLPQELEPKLPVEKKAEAAVAAPVNVPPANVKPTYCCPGRRGKIFRRR